MHLVTLSSFAIAQPLYDLIGKHAEFLVAHHAGPWTIAALVALLSVAVPMALLALVEVSRLIGPRVGVAAHGVAVAALGTLIAGMALRQFPSAIAAPLAIVAGIAVAVAYRHLKFVQRLLTVASAAVLIFPLVFVTLTPVARLVWPERVRQGASTISRRPPIVFVVFDELSTFTLLDRRGEIDGQRFPNFAALAQTASWFPNAVSVFPYTEKAIPALLTATAPSGSDALLPIAADHPQNLFTWLGPMYRMHVAEPVTRLCPRELCDGEGGSAQPIAIDLTGDLAVLYLYLVLPHDIAATRLPSVANAWTRFAETGAQPSTNAARQPFDVVDAFERASRPGRDELVRRFIRGIRRDPQPTLHFLHMLLPHDPYVYLPSGRRYAPGGLTGGLAADGVWTKEQPLIETGRQRHIAQARFVDTLLGELIARLKAENLMDESVLIVTSDHGAAFEPGESHRGLTATNYPEIITSPIFVKLPHQTRPSVSDRHVSGLDILPTIAAVLGTAMPWQTAGRSIFADSYPDRRTIEYAGLGVAPLPTLDVRSEARHGVHGPAALARSTSPQELIGDMPAAIETLPKAAGLHVFSESFNLFRSVRDDGPLLPALVQGHVECQGSCADRMALAIAVNDKVEAVTQTVAWSGYSHYFAALVPESSLHAGANQLDVLSVTGTGAGRKMAAISSEFARGLSIASTDGQEVIVSSEGRRIRLAPDVIGYVDRASNDPDALRLWGWAMDRGSGRPLRSIVAFAGQEAVAFAEPEAERPDVTASFRLEPGRKVSYLLRVAKPDLQLGPLRVFGISQGDRAGELQKGGDTDVVIRDARTSPAGAGRGSGEPR